MADDKPSTPPNLVDQVANLARQAAGVKALNKNSDLIAVPEGMTLISKESVLKPGFDETHGIDRTEHVLSPTAFVDFINIYGSSETVIFLDKVQGKGRAILNYLPRDGSEKKVAYRFDWQLTLELVLSETYKNLVVLSSAKSSLSQTNNMLSQLAALSANFFEPRKRAENIARFRDLDDSVMAQHIHDASLATEAEMLDLIQTRKSPHKRMIANFAFPVFEGAAVREVMLLIEQGTAGPSLRILNPSQLIQDARTASMASIKTKLGSKFAVFDASLDSASP